MYSRSGMASTRLQCEGARRGDEPACEWPRLGNEHIPKESQMQHVKVLTPDLRISIGMATYEGERYIGEQLESLARQKLLPFELFVTDDGSTDGTLDILNAFSEGSPFPVRIFRNSTRLGYEENFL